MIVIQFTRVIRFPLHNKIPTIHNNNNNNSTIVSFRLVLLYCEPSILKERLPWCCCSANDKLIFPVLMPTKTTNSITPIPPAFFRHHTCDLLNFTWFLSRNVFYLRFFKYFFLNFLLIFRQIHNMNKVCCCCYCCCIFDFSEN